MRDPLGVVIPNAEVTFRGEKTVTAMTTQDGSIVVKLPYGSYWSTVARPGFTTSVEQISIRSADPPDLEIVLQLNFSGSCDPCFDVPGIEPQASVLTNWIEAGERETGESRTNAIRLYKSSGRVSTPLPVYAPAPEYSEQARKARYGGTCTVWLIVGANGIPRDIRIYRAIGMGLDEKAVEALRKWKFEPARRGGHQVAVQITVEFNFIPPR